MPDPSFDDLFSAMAAEWNKAEKAIKHAENVDGEVVLPAIFELRYAGRRLVEAQAVKSSDLPLALSLLRDAKFDCHRARHDAIDAVTSKMVGDLHQSVEFLTAKVVLASFPAFPELYSRLDKVRSRIAVSREDRMNRDKVYEAIEAVDLDPMIEMFGNFKACEPLMLKVAEKEAADAEEARLQAETAIRQGKIGTWVGVIGAVIGVLGLILAFAAWKFPV